MDDLIYKQSAINATWFDPIYKDPLNVLTEVRDRIMSLPSAQPGIDVQKLLKAVYDHPLLGEYEKAVITEIVDKLQEEKADD